METQRAEQQDNSERLPLGLISSDQARLLWQRNEHDRSPMRLDAKPEKGK